jgi:hypothetical protein
MMRITVPHYFDFGDDRRLVGDDLVRPQAWDALRTKTAGPFALPAAKPDWERIADERPEIRQRAAEIETWLAAQEARSVASYGVGGAILELWLNRLDPSLGLAVTDYAPATVERLSRLFPEAHPQVHDLLADPPLTADVHLFHRIDTEFTNRQWRTVFNHFASRFVLVVATEVIDLRRAIAEWRTHRGASTATRAGLIRNRAAFEGLWRSTHRATRLRFHDLHAWALEPRQRGGSA